LKEEEEEEEDLQSPGRELLRQLKTLNHNWSTIRKLAQNRQEWRNFVATPHATPHRYKGSK